MPVEVAAAAGTTTMEITVSKFELLRELTATQGVVERKTTIPILSNYLFEHSLHEYGLLPHLILLIKFLCKIFNLVISQIIG